MNSSSTSTSTGPDVGQLDVKTLLTTTFPVPRSADFRVHFDPQAYAGMTSHANEDVSFEICGVLVGDWARDADGPYVIARNYIRCDNAAKKFAEVTFTHESWSHINREMDSKYQDQHIVGWYHSHPNFGIFLSDRDIFIQENFFSGAGQIALVIDPVRKIEGVFEWHHGRPVPSPYFWVGNRILLAPAEAGATGMPEPGIESSVAAEEIPFRPTGFWRGTMPSSSWIMLAGMGLFLLGWTLAGWKTNLERRTIIEGTVAHLGIWGLIRPGLEEQLSTVAHDLEAIEVRLAALAKDHLDRTKKSATAKDGDKAAVQIMQDWKKVMGSTADLKDLVHHVEKLYSLAPEDREIIRRFVEQQFMALSTLSESNPAPRPQSPDGKTNDPAPKDGAAAKTREAPAVPKPKTTTKDSAR